MAVFRRIDSVAPRIVVALAFLLGHSSLAGGSVDLPQTLAFRSFDTADGLANNLVWAIAQDDPGFLWIATGNGVSRFDGLEARNYLHDPKDPTSLSANLTRDVVVDHDGTVWIATWAAGLNRYAPELDGFERFTHDPGDPESLAEDTLRALFVDRQNNLWVGTLTGGLSRLDPDHKGFTHFSHDPTDPTSLSANAIEVIRQDRHGFLWIGTLGGGLNRLDPQSGAVTRFRHDPNDPASLASDDVRSILEDREGRLWIGTWGQGLDLLDRETGTFTHFRHDPGDPRSLPDTSVRPLMQDRRGTIWVGSAANGVSRFDPTSGSFIPSRHDPASRHSVGHGHVRALFEDRRGGIWLGTLGNGLDRFDRTATAFLPPPGLDEISLSTQISRADVFALAVGEEDELWLGTNGSGLARVAPTGTELFRRDPGDPSSLGQDNIWALLRDSRGTLWVGTESNGLDRLDLGRRSFQHYRYDPQDPRSLSNNSVRALLEDRQGAVWIGTAEGLNRFDPATDGFEKARHQADDPNSLSSSYVLSLAEDPAGGLWVGTDGAGLNYLSPQERSKALSEMRWKSSLPSGRVTDLLVDHKGRLWVTGDSTVLRLDFSGSDFVELGERAGLASGVVTSMVEDDEGVIWLGSLTGLARFDEKTETFRNFAKRDGLALDSMAPRAKAKAPDGSLLFGALGGLVSVDPRLVQPTSGTHEVALFDALVDSRRPPITPHVGQKGATDYGLLSISPGESYLKISFAALDFEAPWQYRYRFTLQGFEEGWREVSADRRSAVYTNLAPGDYVFRVQASPISGRFLADGATLGVRVLPAWWQTWWSRAGGVLVVLALLALVVRQRTRRVMLRNRELRAQIEKVKRAERSRTVAEAESSRLQSELEHVLRSSMMSEIAGGLAHELNQPLTAILSNATASQRLLETDDRKEVEEALGDIAHDATRAARVIRRLRQLLESHEPNLKPTAVNEIINEIAPLARAAALLHGIYLEFDLKPDLPAVLVDAVPLQQLVINLVRNGAQAMADSGTLGPLIVSTSLCESPPAVIISVTDSGPPISDDTLERMFQPFYTTKEGGLGMGLAVSKRIIEASHGTISACRNEGPGLTVSVSLPTETESEPGSPVDSAEGEPKSAG
jgi:ligand-binding sensor domain-containing protein